MADSAKKLDLGEADLRRAREWSDRYRIILHAAADGSFTGRGLELPGVIITRQSVDQCVKACRDAMAVAVAVIVKGGGRPPAPPQDTKLEEQVNFRVTREDRLRIEEAASSAGFRGVSDFVRDAVLSRLNGI